MKHIRILQVLAITAVLGLMLGCGQGVPRIEVGADGYGKTTLANGMTVLVNHDVSTELTAARVLIGGGVLTETADNNGITNLMTRMILKGNDKMKAAEITEELDFLGANVNSDCFRDYSTISMVSLTENFEKVLEIVAASLAAPSFPADELDKLKHEVKGDLKAINDNQNQSSSLLFWKTAYGDKAYGLPYFGSDETVDKITAEGIRAHYMKYVGGKNMIVSISTDLPAAQAMAMIDKYLGPLKAEADVVGDPKAELQAGHEGFISFDRNQSFIYTGYVLDHLSPAEVAYVTLINEIMGGSVSARLWYLRQTEKLAYAVYTQYNTDKYGAIFRAAIGTDTTKVKKALSSLKREFDKLIADGLTADELTDAKVNLKNNMIYRIDRKSNRANNMAYYEYIGYGYRFPLDLIAMADDISLAQVNDFITANFTDDRMYLSIVGKK